MKAILIIELDDEWLDRINTTCDEMLADVTLYKKESLENQCDYSQRIYRSWCPLKLLPKKKEIQYPTTDGITTVIDCEYTLNDYLFDKGYNTCLDEIQGKYKEKRNDTNRNKNSYERKC